MKLIQYLFLIYFFFCDASFNKQEYKVIQPATKKELAPIIPKIKRSYKEDEYYSSSENIELCDGYIIDINNDGKKEYVFVSHIGCEGFELDIFVENDKKIEKLEMPYFCAELEYFNPLTKQCELFVEAQGKIYICADSGDTRDIYLWQANNLIAVCDNFWIKQQRLLFNDLFKEKKYRKALFLLKNFEETCRTKIDPQIDLWIRNDIALVALKAGHPFTCWKILQEIQGDTAYAHASAKLIHAIKTNEKLCQTAIEQEKTTGSKGKYDYHWLLSYKGKSNNYIVFDDRFDSLLAAIIPDIEIDQFHGNWPFYSLSSIYLRKDIWYRLVGPEQDVTITANRYVTFSGSFCHSAGEKGMVWCDIKNQISCAVTGSKCSHYTDYDPVRIFSRSLHRGELPKEFLDSLKNWIAAAQIHSSEVIFYDRFGIGMQIHP